MSRKRGVLQPGRRYRRFGAYPTPLPPPLSRTGALGACNLWVDVGKLSRSSSESAPSAIDPFVGISAFVALCESAATVSWQRSAATLESRTRQRRSQAAASTADAPSAHQAVRLWLIAAPRAPSRSKIRSQVIAAAAPA